MKRAWDWFVIISSPLVALGILGTENVAFLRFSAFLFAIVVVLDALEDRRKAGLARRAALTEETGGGDYSAAK